MGIIKTNFGSGGHISKRKVNENFTSKNTFQNTINVYVNTELEYEFTEMFNFIFFAMLWALL